MSAQQAVLNQKDLDSIFTSVIDTIKTDSQKVSHLLSLTSKLRFTKNTKQLINKALYISSTTNNPQDLSKTYYTLGNYQFFNSLLDSSLVSLERALDYIQPTTDIVLNASILSTMGGVYKKKGDVSNAIVLMLEAKVLLDGIDTLKISKVEIGTLKGQNLVVNNSLANFYNQMEDYEKALQYYDETYQSALELKSMINAGVILSNKGDLLLKIERYEEALEILLHSKQLKIEGNAPKRLIAGSDLNIGIAYYKLGKNEMALSSLNEAIDTYIEIDNKSGIIYAFTNRGILYNTLKEFDIASSDCEKAKKLSIQLSNLEFQLKSCECLYEAYKGLGMFEKSLENHVSYLKVKDSLFNEKNIKKLTQLEMQYSFDKTQVLQKNEAIKAKQQQRLLLYLALSGLLIASLLGFFYIKNRKKNTLLDQQKSMLEVTVEEKNVLLKEIHHRVKNNLQVISSLLSLQQRHINEPSAKLAIQEGRDRVKAMALIHQNLYQDTSLIGVEAEVYIKKLANNLVTNYQTDKKNIEVFTEIDHLKLDVDSIIPLGLIINELISNALKYAFDNQASGIIHIKLKEVDNILYLTVKDNGKGMPKDFSIENSSSLGYRLIKAFCEKLKAKLNIESNEKGTYVSMDITQYKTV